MPKRRFSEIDERLRAAVDALATVDHGANKRVAERIGRPAPWLTEYRHRTAFPDLETFLALMRAVGWTLTNDLRGVLEPPTGLVSRHKQELIDILRELDDADVGAVLLPMVRSLARQASVPTTEQPRESAPLPTRASGSKSERGRRRS